MSSELVQIGFFDLENTNNGSNGTDEIIISEDLMALSDDDFEQAIVNRHAQLDQQEEAINAFAEAFKSRIIRERGELYLAAKTRLPHGRYLKLMERMGASSTTAQDYAKLFREHGDELSNARRVGHLGFRQWIRIARSPESHQIIAKLESGELEASPKAINAELEAAKQRAKEAEEKLAAKEQELTLFKDEVETNEQAHTTLVQSLEQKLEEKPEPVKVVEYQDTLETAAKVATLEQQIQDLEAKPDIPPETRIELDKLQLDLKNAKTQLGFYTTQNEALAKEIDGHREAAGRSLEDATALAGRLRIRQVWQYATDEIQASVRKFHTRVPSEIDRESFEGEENTRTAQTIDLLIETAMLLRKTLLSSDSTVDADIATTAISQYQAALPGPTISTDYQVLFAQYQQYVKAFPDEKLWWRAPNGGIMDMEVDRESHITYTRELLKSGDPYRIRCAIEGMKRTLGYGEINHATT